jgi:hypothetical protein
VGLESGKLGKTFWYSIQYEFLPYFCFSCGVLGHCDTVCPTPSKRDEEGNLPWGPFLRAPNDIKKKNGPPFAEGGYDEFYSEFNKDPEKTDTHDNDSGEPSVKPPFRAPLGGRGRGMNGNARGGKLPVYRKLSMIPTGPITDSNQGEKNVVRDLVMYEPRTAGSKREEAELRDNKQGVTPYAKKKKGMTGNLPPLAQAAGQPRRGQ